MQNTKQILLADSHHFYCKGINCFLNDSDTYKIITTIDNRFELFGKIEALNPDILIIDFDTVFDFVMDDLFLLKSKYPKLSICVLTANQNKETILKIYKAGIVNILSKKCTENDFKEALQAISLQKKYLSYNVLDIIIENKNENKKDENLSKITAKEIEIIRLVAQGLTTKDIALKNNTSHHTVNTHRKNILNKLQLKNTSELIMYAVKNGIVETIEYYI